MELYQTRESIREKGQNAPTVGSHGALFHLYSAEQGNATQCSLRSRTKGSCRHGAACVLPHCHITKAPDQDWSHPVVRCKHKGLDLGQGAFDPAVY